MYAIISEVKNGEVSFYVIASFIRTASLGLFSVTKQTILFI